MSSQNSFPIGTAAVLNLNFYLDTRDSMPALFVMDSGTYEIASSTTNEKSGQPIGATMITQYMFNLEAL